jgi:hypothetical protein
MATRVSAMVTIPAITEVKAQIIKNLPARVFMAAWESNRWSRVTRDERASIRFNAGISLSNSSRNNSSSSLGFRVAARSTDCNRARNVRACAVRPSIAAKKMKTATVTRTKTAAIMPNNIFFASLSALKLHLVLKQAWT